MQKLISRSKVISRLLQEMNGIKDSYSNVVADVGFSNENINGEPLDYGNGFTTSSDNDNKI